MARGAPPFTRPVAVRCSSATTLAAVTSRPGLDPLPLTGERTVPGIPEENYWFRRHEAAYQALLPYCTAAVVLEAGCGEGYGADLIAGVASQVIALDYDASAAEHVHRAYPRVAAVRGNLATLPFPESSVDVVAN